MFHTDPPNVRKAKFILAPVAFMVFLIFVGLEVKSYLSQKPVLALNFFNDDRFTTPGFLYAFPWGSEVESGIDGLNDRDGTEIPFAIAGGPSALRLSDVFDITRRSFDTGRSGIPGTLPSVTYYLLMPKKEAVMHPWQLAAEYSLADILPPTVNATDITSVYSLVWLFGSRFTDIVPNDGRNEFSVNTDLSRVLAGADFENRFDTDSQVYGILNQNAVVRDVNPFIENGLFETTRYDLKSLSYKYINGSDENFIQVVNTGSSAFQNEATRSNRTRMEFTLFSPQVTQYTEYYPKSRTTVIGTSMAAFQVIMITGFIILFGRGRYSPYGLVHFLVPGTTVPQYNEKSNISPEEANKDKMKFFVGEYLDTTPAQTHPTSIQHNTRFPFARLTAISLASAGCALVLYLVVALAGFQISGLYFLSVTDNSLVYTVSFWGACQDGNCNVADPLQVFSHFGVSSPSELDLNYPTQNWMRVFSNERSGLGFMFAVFHVVLLGITILTKLGSAFMSFLAMIEVLVLPILGLVSVLLSLVGVILMLSYYISLRDYINITIENLGGSARAELGPAVAIYVIAVVLVIVFVVSTQIEAEARVSEIRRLQREAGVYQEYGFMVDEAGYYVPESSTPEQMFVVSNEQLQQEQLDQDHYNTSMGNSTVQ